MKTAGLYGLSLTAMSGLSSILFKGGCMETEIYRILLEAARAGFTIKTMSTNKEVYAGIVAELGKPEPDEVLVIQTPFGQIMIEEEND
jgi:hypothetical protein